jgi:hypothetical protein
MSDRDIRQALEETELAGPEEGRAIAARLMHLKETKTAIDAEILQCEQMLDEILAGPSVYGVGLYDWRVTPVRSSNTVVHWDVLDQLRPGMAEQLMKPKTEMVQDTDALAELIRAGEFTPEELNELIEEIPKKTSIKITQMKDPAEGEAHGTE